jgi:hypothetical protein
MHPFVGCARAEIQQGLQITYTYVFFFFLIGSDDGKKNSLAIHPCIHRDLFLSFRGPDGT